MKKRYWEILILAALSFLPFFWLRDGQIILGHDSGFRLDPAGQLATLFYSWYPKWNFGMDISLYKGFLVIQSPEAFFTFITGSVSVGQQITCSLYFFLIGASMYILTKTLFPDAKYWILRLYAGIFYMYNFFILQGWFIAERAKFSVYAALPLYIAVLHLTFTKRIRIRKAVLFTGLISLFLNAGGSPPLFIPVLSAVFLAYGAYGIWYMRTHGFSGIWFVLKIGGLFALSYALVNAYWILPLFALYTGNFSSSLAGQGGIEGILSWERMISKNASILNIARLQGIPDWYDNVSHPYANEFLRNPVLIVLSFIPIALVLSGFFLGIFQRKWKENPVLFYLFILLLIGIFFSTGTHKPFGIIYEKLMIHVPGFTLFRSSFYKFAPLVWFSVILLSGYALNTVIITYIKKRLLIAGMGIIVCAGIVAYHYPFYARDFFRFENGFTTRLRLPSYVREMTGYINEKTDPAGAILVLPELSVGYYGRRIDTYSWGYFSIELLPREANRTFLANDDGSPEIVSSLYRAFYENDRETFQTIAGMLGVRHILWRGDTKQNASVEGERNPQDSKDRVASFGFPLAYKSGYWELYDIRSPAEKDIVSVSPAIRTVDGGNFTSFDAWIRNAPQPLGTAVLSRVPEEAQPAISELSDASLYEPECMLCSPHEFEKTASSITLPDTTALLRRIRRMAFGGKDERLLKTEQEPAKRIDLLLSYMTGLVSSITGGKNKDVRDAYAGSLEDLSTELEKLKGVEKNKYAVRILLYLSFHQKEMEKHGGEDDMLRAISQRISLYSERAHYTKQPGFFAYVVDVPDGDYLWQADLPPDGILVDGRHWAKGTPLTLSGGYHELSLAGTQLKPPSINLIRESLPKKHLGTPGIRFEKINPTRYVVHIRDASDPYVLLLRQQYDAGWRINVPGHHMTANGFENAWFIDKKGSYKLMLTYAPQRIFLAGAGISALAVFGIIVLGIFTRKKNV